MKFTSQENYFENTYGRLRDVCINPHNGAIYFATNGATYPGSGPNSIIEYRNLDFVTSSTTESSFDQFMEVFPNPIGQSEELNIHFSENFLHESLQLISFSGQIFLTQRIQSPSLAIPLHNLPKGNYYLRATNTTGTITKKVIVQ